MSMVTLKSFYFSFNFLPVLGHALRLGLIGSHVNKDPKFAQDIYKMVELAKKDNVKSWERQHANAVRLFAEGYCLSILIFFF